MGSELQPLSAMSALGLEGSCPGEEPPHCQVAGQPHLSGVVYGGTEVGAGGQWAGLQIPQVPSKHNEQRNQLPQSWFSQTWAEMSGLSEGQGQEKGAGPGPQG